MQPNLDGASSRVNSIPPQRWLRRLSRQALLVALALLASLATATVARADNPRPPMTEPQTQTGVTTAAAAGAPVKTVYRSERTDIAEDGATEFWFPVRGRDCDPPDPSKCGWLSIPADLRDNLDNRWNPVSELATDVYTALDPSPDSTPRGAPGGVVKLELWAVFPHPERGTNSVSKVAGPYQTPFTVCLPSPAADRVIQVYDRESRQWTTFEQVEAEHEGHVCGLANDLGYIGLATS